MIPFQSGDRVKMTDRYAAVLMMSNRVKVDWRTRRGVVERGNRDSVIIRWNDRTSVDQYPNGAIELDASKQ